MPHTTHAYKFESKVLMFAQKLAAELSGPMGKRSFRMELNEDGSVRVLEFESSELQSRDRLESARSYLVYDPFDAPEYIALSWRNINRSRMEHLIGERFEQADFLKEPHSPWGVPELDPPSIYPESWTVMF